MTPLLVRIALVLTVFRGQCCSGRLLPSVFRAKAAAAGSSSSPPPPDARRTMASADKPVRPNPSRSSALADVHAASLAVTSLPGLTPGAFATRQWAGHLPVPYAGRDVYGHVFHWLFAPAAETAAAEAAGETPRLPLIICT